MSRRSPDVGIIEELPDQFGKAFNLELYRRGCFCRAFEQQVKAAFDAKKIQIPIYLSLGQEFNGVALSMVLQGVDIFAQHRCHSLYLSFGGKPEALRDELLGLDTGCSRGMSGSNAIQAPEINMFGHSGLMGEQVPIAVGAALASKQHTLTIAGDASIEEDYIYPSLGYAATMELPILFICEDNGLSILTPVEVRRNWSIVDMANSLGIQAMEIADDPWTLAHHAQTFKAAGKPMLLNVHTVRDVWHAGTGTDGPPEWDRWALVRSVLEKLGYEQDMNQIEAETREQARALWAEQ